MRHKSIYTWGWHCWLHGFVFGYWCLGWALLGKKKCLSDTHLPWDIGSHSGISIHNGLISIEIVLITLKKEPAVTNWIASSPSCSFSSVETLAMILEDCKHQIFNEIPQEYPLKNLTYNSRPQTVGEIHQKSSMHERLLLLWEDLCPGFVPRLLCALLRICRGVHSLSLWTGRSGHQGNFVPLKVQQEYFITQNSDLKPQILLLVFTEFILLLCLLSVTWRDQSRIGEALLHISPVQPVWWQATSEQAVVKLPAWLCSLSPCRSLQGPCVTYNSSTSILQGWVA